MSNYLKIIFQCDLILQNKFLYFRGEGGGTILRSMEKKFRRKNTPPLQGGGGGPFLEGTYQNRENNKKISNKMISFNKYTQYSK